MWTCGRRFASSVTCLTLSLTGADVLEVNGLTVDWRSSHIYWTDGRKRTVEVAEFDGTNRRILVTEQLSQPRGIFADPVNGFVVASRAHVYSLIYHIYVYYILLY